MTVRVGLIGAGNIAVNHHMPWYDANGDRAQVVAVADPSAERRALVEDRLGIATEMSFERPEDLFEHARLDVVDICTPPGTHLPLIAGAAERSLHILCEKPLATIPAEAAAAVQAARDAGVTLGMMHNYLFRPDYRALREAIDAGAVGDVEVVILNFLGVLDLPGTQSFDPRWRHNLSRAGGGVLMDMLHVVYVAEALIGQRIRRVSGWTHARDSAASVEDIALSRLEGDSAVALTNVGWGAGPGGLDVSGSQGRVSARFEGGGTAPFAPLESVTAVDGAGNVRAIDFPEETLGIGDTMSNFYDAIASGAPPVADGADGAHTLEATLATYASAAWRTTVELPLAIDSDLFTRGALALASDS